MTDSMGPGKLVRRIQNPAYIYDKYLICIGLGPSISPIICKNLSYSGPSYPSSPVVYGRLIPSTAKFGNYISAPTWHFAYQFPHGRIPTFGGET